MKIKTITCSNADNHGARLQTYALAKYLKDNGHDVEVIDYQPHYMRFKIKRFYFAGTNIKEWVKLVVRYKERCRFIKRHQLFEKFSANNIPLTSVKYFDYEQLQKQAPAADVYIAGSDQIWNTNFYNGHDRAFFLDFGDETTKRISYAASFAIPALKDDDKTRIARQLNRFNSISVRENSALDIVNDLGYKAARVVDPVFLLPKEFWDGMCSDVEQAKDYILVYDFERNNEIATIAKRIAGLRRKKIVSVAPFHLGYCDKDYTECNPETFLSLIKNADCVISNSFHGTAFAMLFGTDFFVVNRKDGLNVRMFDLLSAYNAESKLIDVNASDIELLTPINHDTYSRKLQADIDKSKQWLNDAINK